MSLEAPIPVILRASFEAEAQQRTPSPSLRAPIYAATSPRATSSSVSGAFSEMDPTSARSSSSGHASPQTAASMSVHSPVTDASDGGLSSTQLVEEPNMDVDPQIIEALKSKDRMFVLQLGEIMESLILERQTRADVHPTSSYQRLLVYRCAVYYKCVPENDSSTKALLLSASPESKIPLRRLSELVPIESVAQPTFRIMRRSSRDRMRARGSSTAGSVAGEDADLSDVEPSEAGSLYSRTSAKKRPTIEEREAAYQQARSRIFMNFEEKERAKAKDMSAASSIVSGSASTSGDRSSVDDLEAESATTESEWSAPASRDNHKRGGDPARSHASQRSHSRKARSARGSRTTSPTPVTYASIYEPPGAYDQGYAPGAAPSTGYPPYGYPYSHQGSQSPSSHVYMPPYTYYGPYYTSPAAPVPGTDGSSPSAGEPYGHPPPMQPMYPHSYMPWAPPSADAVAMQHPVSPPQYPVQHPPPPNSTMPPPAPPGTSYAPYAPPYMTAPPAQYGHYAYYPPPGQPMPPPPPHMASQPPYVTDPARGYEGNGPPTPSNHSRTSSRNSSSSRRGAPPVRSAWSFGSNASLHNSSEVVGPRLSVNARRLSGASSVGSGSAGNRTPGDDASSTVSSSTSSSSARTFTSTSTSSKHPLPARPDWAIGLSPSNRHHDSNGRGRNGQAQRQSPAPLQSTDFPPLSGAAAPPRAPVAGAWTNTSSTRQILARAPIAGTQGQGQGQGSPEQDRTYERPPPKTNAELFNPKSLAKKPGSGHRSNGSQSESMPLQAPGGGDIGIAALADATSALRMDDGKDGKADRAL